MSIDVFQYRETPITGPAVRMFAVTPNDSTDITWTARMLFVGDGGNVAVRDQATGSTVVHINVASGTYIGPFAIDRVLATNTTATNIIAYAWP